MEEILSLATRIARQAGSLLLSRFRGRLEVSRKGRIDLVTEMDLEAERLILGQISQRFPGHAILAEEAGRGGGGDSWRWIIDPLDGTTNYAHGYPVFAVSIALEHAGELLAGVIYNPVQDEMFSALRGRGASLNGRPLHVSAVGRLEESLLCTGFAYQREEMRRNLALFEGLLLEAQAVRRDGSAALDLCSVAAGRFEGFWEIGLNPWDVAAGIVIVEEAGGRVTRFDGSDSRIDDREIAASNGSIHAALLERLASAGAVRSEG